VNAVPVPDPAGRAEEPIDYLPMFWDTAQHRRVRSHFTLAPAADALVVAETADASGAEVGTGPEAAGAVSPRWATSAWAASPSPAAVPRVVGANGTARVLGPSSSAAGGRPVVGPRGASPQGGSAVGEGAGGVDWGLVRVLRAGAAQELSDVPEVDGGDGAEDAAQVEDRGQRVIARLVREAAANRLAVGQVPWSPTEQEVLARAVFNGLFRMGRFQDLLDDDRVENIIVTAHDQVVLELMDGSVEPGPPVADSYAELRDFLVFLAGRHGMEFSESHSRLDLRLPDGSRLAAKGWVTPSGRISAVIRRHRLRQVRLSDLVEAGVVTAVLASFLAAAVRAGLNVVVSGGQKVGKTTLARALCAEIPREHSIVVIEDTGELFLHEFPEQHLVVHSWETRRGTGEVGFDGRRAGEITAAELLGDAMRFAADRTIVGEVRGEEALVAMKAFASGGGGLTTTHSGDALGALRKLVLCVRQAGVDYRYARDLVAENVDLVVHVRMAPTGQGRRRWVDEVVAVGPGEEDLGWAFTQVFAPDSGALGRPAVAAVVPDTLAGALVEYGFDADAFDAERGGR